MYIKAYYDHEATLLSEKLTFFCDEFEITQEDITAMKKNKVLNLVKWDDLPKSIPCQVLLQMESNNMKAFSMKFMNPSFVLPLECYDEQFLNRDLLAWSADHGGFWLECVVPLHNKFFEIDLSIKA